MWLNNQRAFISEWESLKVSFLLALTTYMTKVAELADRKSVVKFEFPDRSQNVESYSQPTEPTVTLSFITSLLFSIDIDTMNLK